MGLPLPLGVFPPMRGKKKGDQWYHHLVPVLNLALNLLRLFDE
jgi:hypothetical protein